MAKSTLEQWDETNANNTDVGSINIDEGCAPSGINNALREQMSQTAKWLGDDTLASATSTDLGSVPGRYVSVTGTTTITGLGTIKAGTIKYVKFAGILTLTHNATSLILPGAANITTAAGDAAIFVSEGSGNWRCLSYQKASGPVAAATQAEQEAASSTAVYVSPGRQQFHPSAAKVWVLCDAAGNIQSSYNVTSVTDDGVGLVTVTFANDFSDANFCAWATANDNTTADQLRGTSISARAAGSLQAKCVNTVPAKADPVFWNIGAFGDLA